MLTDGRSLEGWPEVSRSTAHDTSADFSTCFERIAPASAPCTTPDNTKPPYQHTRVRRAHKGDEVTASPELQKLWTLRR
jgi:hypothetical protein